MVCQRLVQLPHGCRCRPGPRLPAAASRCAAAVHVGQLATPPGLESILCDVGGSGLCRGACSSLPAAALLHACTGTGARRPSSWQLRRLLRLPALRGGAAEAGAPVSTARREVDCAATCWNGAACSGLLTARRLGAMLLPRPKARAPSRVCCGVSMAGRQAATA